MPTRPSISWSDLAGASVGVFGLGIEGMANLTRLLELGADVAVVEDSPSVDVALGQPVLPLGNGGLEALCKRAVVVKTPGVRRRRPEMAQLDALGIPVVGGLGLWMNEAPLERVAAITGTKGKSTTTAIAGHLLDHLGYRCLVAGNIGQPPYGPGAMTDFDYAIVEVSSYQATDLAVSPPVVAVTSLHPDHLDWHGGVEEYFTDKLSACTQSGADLTIADADSPMLRAHAHLLGPRIRWVSVDDGGLGGDWVDALGLTGAHNRRNAMIARAVLQALSVPEAGDPAALAEAAVGFAGLESRLAPVGAIGNVRFVDDSLSTNVLATVAALEAYASDRVALIVGGHDRGIDYAPLAEAIVDRASAGGGVVAVFTLPESGPRIHAAILARDGGSAIEGTDCDDIDHAVALAFDWARLAGGVVLLSPASPSFGQFHDYKDRSAHFVAAMRLREARYP
jgi:UDP-N-acetylmuramoylalanine--D-glutamate ligase